MTTSVLKARKARVTLLFDGGGVVWDAMGCHLVGRLVNRMVEYVGD